MDGELDALLHLYMLNRGILLTPFHMMALISGDDGGAGRPPPRRL